jgi:nucleotide-binding universal stress UspA family protein
MKFLVAADGSQESDDALAYATDIADAMNGSITVVHAVDPSVYEEGGDDPIAGPPDADRRFVQSVGDAEKRGLAVLEQAAEFASDLGQEVETELLYGEPIQEITEYAESEDADAIFVGHRGRSERTDRMLGSVAKDLVERATVPVTVVR